MGSASEWMARLAPAAIVLKAIVVSVAGISALMIFIMARRWWRARYFARRERQTFETPATMGRSGQRQSRGRNVAL